MAGSKEIRNKIRSVRNTQKITKAMEMVAAAKMRKVQERTRATRPYATQMLRIVSHLARANTEYKHPFLVRREGVKRVGSIVITSDKGLAGGLNTNVLRVVVAQAKEWQDAGIDAEFVALGNKGFGFLQRMNAKIVSHVVGLGDTPHLERLLGAVRVMMTAYVEGRIDEVHLFYSRFVNTMRQDPSHTTLLPLPEKFVNEKGEAVDNAAAHGSWDYIYEPNAREMLDLLLERYVELIVYQAVVENMASEQSARMVAMKAASDNAGTIIDELTLIYNKTRQAAITKELSEIVGGAAAV